MTAATRLRSYQRQAGKTTEPWVVTYHAEFVDGCSTAEGFRGPKAECFRIAMAFGGWGEDDSRRNRDRWSVQMGRAQDWDDFLADMEN